MSRNTAIGESGGLHKTPHAVSLKVLRLSRPSLAHQFALPNAQDLGISPSAALAYPAPPTSPTASPNTRTSPDAFILSPVLNLPETFGSAYVGETFSCTLCANNELSPSDKTRVISGVKIQGEMQTPSTPAGSPLELEGEEESSPGPGDSLQRILRFELKEEGNHVLAVTVTYTETTLAGEGMAASGKVRTFRKLYQFVALQLLSVRTKTGQVGDGTKGTVKVLLEAQLENVGEVPISFEAVNVNPKPPFKSTSLNWDMPSSGAPVPNAPVLNPKDVIQVAFLLERQNGEGEAENDGNTTPSTENRQELGQLVIQWRGALGDRGSLSTGWLTYRKRS